MKHTFLQYYDHVALLNQYTVWFWRRYHLPNFGATRGLKSKTIQSYVRMVYTLITRGNMLSTRVTGVPFYRLLDSFSSCYHWRVNQQCLQLKWGCFPLPFWVMCVHVYMYIFYKDHLCSQHLAPINMFLSAGPILGHAFSYFLHSAQYVVQPFLNGRKQLMTCVTRVKN